MDQKGKRFFAGRDEKCLLRGLCIVKERVLCVLIPF